MQHFAVMYLKIPTQINLSKTMKMFTSVVNSDFGLKVDYSSNMSDVLGTDILSTVQ